MTTASVTLLAFLETWQWAVAGGLAVLIIILLIIKKRQENV